MAEDSSLRDEVDALKSDLANLRSDISELTGAVRDLGYAKAGEWRSSFEEEVDERREDLRRAMNAARERGRKAEGDFERQVGEHPWSSLLAALGVGFIVAKVMDRGERR